MMNWLKNSWKVAVTIVGGLAILATLITFNSRYATSEDLKQTAQSIRTENSIAIQELRKSMELDRDIARLNMIMDNLVKAKLLQRQYPNDPDIKTEIEELKLEKEKIQKRIEKMQYNISK